MAVLRAGSIRNAGALWGVAFLLAGCGSPLPSPADGLGAAGAAIAGASPVGVPPGGAGGASNGVTPNGGAPGGSMGGAGGASTGAGGTQGGSPGGRSGAPGTSGAGAPGGEAGSSSGTGGAPSGGNASAAGASGRDGGGGDGGGGDGAGGAAVGQAGGGSSGNGGSGGATAVSYEPCPLDGACKILPFGDSITEGYPIWGGYRTGLFRLALEAGQSITFVGSANNGPDTVDDVPFPQEHEGHGGFTIDDEPARGTNGISPFIPSSIDDYQPDIITLMIGTNDINGNIDVADAPARLATLLDAIFDADPDVLVVLAQMVPTRNDGTNQAVSTYNAAIPALVEERAEEGRHILLVDMYGAFTRDADYKTALLGDNLHPNQAGYDRMAETWYEVLEPFLR